MTNNIVTDSHELGVQPKLYPERFFGHRHDFKPEIVPYDKNRIAFGIWDFRIKYSDSKPPTSSFNGIYRNGFIDLLNSQGFYKRFRADESYFFLRCIDNMIEEVDMIQVSDFVTEYLNVEGEDVYFEYNVDGDILAFTASLLLQKETIKKQCHSLFNKKFLEQLPTFTTEILQDTRRECYKLFNNAIVKITSDGFELLNYKDLKGKCVWKKHRKQFDFQFTEDYTDCHLFRFIENVSNSTEDHSRHHAFITAIGYMLHDYNAPEKGQAIILYDEVITDISKPQGGTGKGVFAKALSFASELVKIDGKKFDENDRFCLQLVCDSTQIVFFDDVKSKLGFDRFNSMLTDGWNIEKKNRDEFRISSEDSPKVLISSNSILECEGSTRKRRQSILEFSDYYSKHIKKGNEAPIQELHGCIFFSQDWDNCEWGKFYSFLIQCISEYMKYGLLYYEPKNVKANRLRQVTSDDFAEWIGTQSIAVNQVHETKLFYDNFLATYPDDKFNQRRFSSYLKKYAALNDWILKHPPASSGRTYFEFCEKK